MGSCQVLAQFFIDNKFAETVRMQTVNNLVGLLMSKPLARMSLSVFPVRFVHIIANSKILGTLLDKNKEILIWELC